MIISPPFLSSHQPELEQAMSSAEAGDTVVPDHNVCLAGMQECAPGNGAYPVSYSLGWHGGPHLITPRDARGNAERARAIADGVVVYVRQNDAKPLAGLRRWSTSPARSTVHIRSMASPTAIVRTPMPSWC